MNTTDTPPPMLGAIDLSNLGRKPPEPVPGERVITRTFAIPNADHLPRVPPIAAGETNTGRRFEVGLAGVQELHLRVDEGDLRVLGIPHLVEGWLDAIGATNVPASDPLLDRITTAMRAANDARIITALDDSPAGAELAHQQVTRCIEALEGALRKARGERADLEQQQAGDEL